jgi:hypothetical protein
MSHNLITRRRCVGGHFAACGKKRNFSLWGLEKIGKIV